MRVCFVGHQAVKEGASLFMLDQIDFLLREGITVFAILPRIGVLADALVERGVEISIVPSAWWTTSRWLSGDADFAGSVSSAHTMANLFRRWEIDVVYTETVVAPNGALGAALAGLPHVWHIHEFTHNPRAIEMAFSRDSLARLIDLTSNLVFFNSKAVAREWEGRFPAGKTRVVYNWISAPVGDVMAETARPGSSPEQGNEKAFRVAIVGSILRWKRQMDAIHAIGNLLREGHDLTLDIVGPVVDPAYNVEMLKVVQENGWANKVQFVGYTENPHALMRGAHVTLVCSEGEPFGRVTIESMAQGTPVIGTNSGGTAEIIDDGVDGLLYPTADVDALTHRLRSLVLDEPLRQRLADGAREKAKQFRGAEPIMRPVVDLLEALVGEKNPSWPLGDVIGSGLSALGIPEARPPRPPLYGAAITRLKRAIRRIWRIPS